MADFAPLNPDAQVGYLVVRAAELLSGPWTAGLREHGINPRQFSVLSLIAADPGLSQAELARRSSITPQSMGELLSRLQDAGFVERADPSIGRSARIEVTDAGRATLVEAYPVVQRLQNESVASLDPEERSELTRLLAKLIAHLSAG